MQNKSKYNMWLHTTSKTLKAKHPNPSPKKKTSRKTNTVININNLYYNIRPAWSLSLLFDQNLTEKLTEAHWHNL
jgi:hypothetical protein